MIDARAFPACASRRLVSCTDAGRFLYGPCCGAALCKAIRKAAKRSTGQSACGFSGVYWFPTISETI